MTRHLRASLKRAFEAGVVIINVSWSDRRRFNGRDSRKLGQLADHPEAIAHLEEWCENAIVNQTRAI